MTHLLGHVPDGIPVTFTSTLGNLSQLTASLTNGISFNYF